ncbi:MAG TPA: type II/IV secretion system protein [Candidatus Desulfofervidus auxilii]|uniref:Type II/IV secretion system protein n=1 Tax=Desulfofervidus auxilii TaxID=1621989 RepID=A0A7V0IAC6_DESA2|nr:type II/IV secretion system protein [Candidatus Desulfofervidus auxilii]
MAEVIPSEEGVLTKEKAGKRLGDILVEKALITPEQLKIALEIQKTTGKLLGEILVDLGFVEQTAISSLLSKDIGVQFLSSLENVIPDPEALSIVPHEVALKHKVVPLNLENGILTVVVSDPFDIFTVDTLRKLTGKAINTVVASETEIAKAIDLWYAERETFDSLVKQALASVRVTEVAVEEPPLIKLVNHIIVNGIKKRATDIHIEPEKNAVVIRYRIDGILYVWNLLPKELQKSIISRIKVMASLDISESRLPQDGRAPFFFAGRNMDLRISTYPTADGENVVLRILDKTQLIRHIDGLGFSKTQLEVFKHLLQYHYGMLLVTGPTGSGKTTTLYAALLNLNSTDVNIMTVEDPIEYELPFIRQSQINIKAGFSFARGLRAILRQDPDIILVGEIRDKETLEVAVHAALTGHLVLSTLHTNYAIAAISRLLYMGISPYILASSLIGVVSQRLVRKICPYCKCSYRASVKEREFIQTHLGNKINLAQEFILFKGKGCERCSHTGYFGRTVISEVFEVNEEIFDAITRQAHEEEIKKILEKQGFISMFEDGLYKALEGVTTLNEVLRVI